MIDHLYHGSHTGAPEGYVNINATLRPSLVALQLIDRCELHEVISVPLPKLFNITEFDA